MLTPDQLKNLPDNIVRIFLSLEDHIIADIARRLAKTGEITDMAKLELEIAKEIKTPLKEIEKAIQDATDLAVDEVDRLLKDSAIKSLDFEDAIYKSAGMDPARLYASGKIAQIVNEAVLQTRGELYNLTGSLGFAVEQGGKTVFKPIAQFYQDSLDDALMKVRMGSASYQEATRAAVKKMSGSGLSFVDYKTGHINRLDVASRRAILTGTNQMNLQMTGEIMDELGAEYIETTAHAGARPDHAAWQGKVYHVGGSIDGYPDFESATGYGTGAGLGGWNCRHSYFPFFPGISERTWTDEQLANIDPPPIEYLGEKYTHYEATQVQRVMETDMRKTKREIIGHEASGDKQAFQNMSIKLQGQKQDYRNFCNAAGLRYQFERAGIEGYGRSISSRSVWGARNHHAEWLKSIGAESSSLNTLAKYYNAKYNNTKEFQLLKGYSVAVKKGDISPFVGFDLYKKIANEIDKTFVGLTTSYNHKINGYVSHFIDRIIGMHAAEDIKKKGWRRGVKLEDALDALKNPMKIGKVKTNIDGKKSIVYYSKNAMVTINPDTGELIQANPRRRQ